MDSRRIKKRRTKSRAGLYTILVLVIASTVVIGAVITFNLMPLSPKEETNEQEQTQKDDEKSDDNEKNLLIKEENIDIKESAEKEVIPNPPQENIPEKQTQDNLNEQTTPQQKDVSSENNNSDKPWNLLLVNPWNKLPEGYTFEQTTLGNGYIVDERAYPDLQKMMDDCRAEGLSPLICSAYRSIDRQTTLFNNQIAYYKSQGYSDEGAKEQAGQLVAVPGTSEHHTGLALDIVATSNQNLTEEQANTAEQQWLMKNSYKYGFILRYTKEKQDITGINYEPWHYRYVGKDVAKEIYEQGICLEEYLEDNY